MPRIFTWYIEAIVDVGGREHHTLGSRPLTEAPYVRHVADDQIVLGMSLEDVDISLHFGVEHSNNANVAVAQVVSVGNLNDGASPAAGASATAGVGRGVLNVTRENVLAVGNVGQPLHIEGLGVEGLHNRRCNELTVTCVAEFFSCRTVEGNASVNVVKECSYCRFIEPVECFVAGLKGACYGKVCVNNYSFDRFCICCT